MQAPVLITACNRYAELKMCIDSLKENSIASGTSVYVAVDYPLEGKRIEEHDHIIKYLRELQGFKEIIPLIRDTNYGYIRNMQDAMDYMFQKYDRVIYTEDDNIFSAIFLEYMNKCLDYFEHSDQVLSISGFTSCVPVDTPNNVFANQGFSFWGVGIWRDKWYDLNSKITIEAFQNIADSPQKLLNMYKHSKRRLEKFVRMYILQEYVIQHDSAYGCISDAHDMYRICPAVSMVKNIGCNEKGVHNWKECSIDHIQNVKLSEDEKFNLEIKDDIFKKRYLKKLNQIPNDTEFLTGNDRVHTIFYCVLFCIFGCKKVLMMRKEGNRIWEKMKNMLKS